MRDISKRFNLLYIYSPLKLPLSLQLASPHIIQFRSYGLQPDYTMNDPNVPKIVFKFI